jgi:hypothetical protein
VRTAHLLIVSCDPCDTDFIIGNRVRQYRMGDKFSGNAILGYNTCATNQVSGPSQRAFQCHTYLLMAHPEQQPAKYRTVEGDIFKRSPIRNDLPSTYIGE